MDRKILILYGSQSGTAQEVAEDIWRQSKKYHFKGTVKSMNSYTIENLITEKLVIFVCATTGQGDVPDNMNLFWKFLLRKNLPPNSLSNIKFAVLGLGDSSYEKYNFVAKRLNRRLIQLGGSPIVTIGLCDDQHDLGLHAVAVPWIKDLWDRIDVHFPLPSDMAMLPINPRVFRWDVESLNSDETEKTMNDSQEDFFIQDSKLDEIITTNVLDNERTTSLDHFQDVRLLTFDASLAKWNPGDVLLCRPKNSSEKVEQLFNLFSQNNLNLHRSTIILINEIDDDMPVPECLKNPINLEVIATEYWDLNAIPRPRVFELLALNCENELEKEKLIEFTKAEHQDELFTYANRPRRTVLEVLFDFPHAAKSLTIQTLFEIFSPIRARSFSIASCKEMNKLQILVAVVKYKTILSTPRIGLCSQWLSNLKKGDTIRVWIRKGIFKIPLEESTPIIMVGPGTGLAPFRSIMLQNELCNKNISCQVLFFGCRNSSKDFHCEEDLKRLEATGKLNLFCAFSRDQEDKVYVQHKIKEQHNFIFNLLQKNATILVAGNSKDMPTAVKSAFSNIINPEYIKTMEKNGRYQEETWG